MLRRVSQIIKSPILSRSYSRIGYTSDHLWYDCSTGRSGLTQFAILPHLQEGWIPTFFHPMLGEFNYFNQNHVMGVVQLKKKIPKGKTSIEGPRSYWIKMPISGHIVSFNSRPNRNIHLANSLEEDFRLDWLIEIKPSILPNHDHQLDSLWDEETYLREIKK